MRLLVPLSRHLQALFDQGGQVEQPLAMLLPPLLVEAGSFVERDVVGSGIEGLQ